MGLPRVDGGGVDVDCVHVGEEADDPELGPVVRGYARAPVASVPFEAPPKTKS